MKANNKQVVATTNPIVVANGNGSEEKKVVTLKDVPVGKRCKTPTGFVLQGLVEGSSLVIVDTPKGSVNKMNQVYPVHQLNQNLEVELL